MSCCPRCSEAPDGKVGWCGRCEGPWWLLRWGKEMPFCGILECQPLGWHPKQQAVAWETGSTEAFPGVAGPQQGPPLGDSCWKQRESCGEDQSQLDGASGAAGERVLGWCQAWPAADGMVKEEGRDGGGCWWWWGTLQRLWGPKRLGQKQRP